MRLFPRRPPPDPGLDWGEIVALEVILRPSVEQVLAVEQRETAGRALAYRGRLRLPPAPALEALRREFGPHGFTPFLRQVDGATWVHALPLAEVTDRPNPWINVGLFLATVLSTLLAGAWLLGGVPFEELLARPGRLLAGVPFSASLLSILLFHELGHYALGRRHGMPITLPYFIPAPPPFFFVGTLGAVIRLRGPVRDRRSLFDMAVAGPLAGLLLAVPICILGLRLSTVGQVPTREGGGGLELGESLLLKLLEWWVLGPVAADHVVVLHPVGVAAWFGFFVTVLNLMPVGQLDGGHLVYALFGRRHALISKLAIGGLVLLGLAFRSTTWVVWPVLVVALMGVQHSPPMDDITPLDGRRQALGLFTLLLLFLLLPPVPLAIR